MNITVKDFINLCIESAEQEYRFYDTDSGDEMFGGMEFYGDDIPDFILNYTVESYDALLNSRDVITLNISE